jgi:GNAT superfamily N-acetyltransferase
MMEIRPFDFAKESGQFCLLYHRVYGPTVGENYVRWKFLENPSGPAFGFGAWDGERLAGFVALTPYRFAMSGEEILAAQGADTMVLAEYRGKGLFVELSERLLEGLRERRLLFRYSAPGLMSYPGYLKKLKHELVTYLPYWVKFRPIQWAKRKLGMKDQETNMAAVQLSFNEYSVASIDRFGPEYDSFEKESRKENTISIIKNSAYLNWRYASHPLYTPAILECRKNGLLAGYAVLHGGNLLELLAGEDNKAYDCLIRSAEAFWNISGCVMSHGWFLGEPESEKALKDNGWVKYGLSPRPFGLYPCQPLICYANPDIGRARSVFKADSWRFSMGDVDCM